MDTSNVFDILPNEIFEKILDEAIDKTNTLVSLSAVNKKFRKYVTSRTFLPIFRSFSYDDYISNSCECDRYNEIPYWLVSYILPLEKDEKVKQLIYEHDEENWRKERESEEEANKQRKLEEHKKATLSEEEYRKWVDDSIEEWIDEQFCYTSMIEYNLHQNEEQCERWLQEQLKIGRIACKNGKYKYYG
jgi:hypothetical protein